MATLVFIDFDAAANGAQGTAPTTWGGCMKPQGVYDYAGVLTQNQTLNSGDHNAIHPGYHADSSAYGQVMGGEDSSVLGCVIGIHRATFGIGDELWATWNLQLSKVNTAPLGVNYGLGGAMAAGTYELFRWGQLSCRLWSVMRTDDDPVDLYTLVFHVINNGTAVTEVTVPGHIIGSWLYVQIHAKLHASTGLFAVTINGIDQAAAYTGQNTVSAIAANSTGTIATADHVYVGTATWHNASSCTIGGLMDDILIDGAGFPPGRPTARRWNLGTSSFDAGWDAVGLGATTIPAALTDPTDTKAARGIGSGARTEIGLAAGGGGGDAPFGYAIADQMIGANIYLKRPTKRIGTVDLRLRCGLVVDGVDEMGDHMEDHQLYLDTVETPPAENYPVSGLCEGVYPSTLTVDTVDASKVIIEVL